MRAPKFLTTTGLRLASSRGRTFNDTSTKPVSPVVTVGLEFTQQSVYETASHEAVSPSSAIAAQVSGG